MRTAVAVLLLALALPGCSRNIVSVKYLLGMEKIEVAYLLDDGRWVPADSLSWRDRSWYRELRFDPDRNGEWNYLYREVYDDVAGWTWVPSSVRINPEEEPGLAQEKCSLVREPESPPRRPSLDDFGYQNP